MIDYKISEKTKKTEELQNIQKQYELQYIRDLIDFQTKKITEQQKNIKILLIITITLLFLNLLPNLIKLLITIGILTAF